MTEQKPVITKNFGTEPHSVKYSNNVAIGKNGDEIILDFFHQINLSPDTIEVNLQTRLSLPKHVALVFLKHLSRELGVNIPNVSWPSN